MKQDKYQQNILRIIDANLNRSREGLRVCEEVARFILANSNLAKELRTIRHQISFNLKKFFPDLKTLVRSRDSQRDIGKSYSEQSLRKNHKDIFSANMQRVKESLRVLEECSKIYDQKLSRNFFRLRFKAYRLEKKIVERL